jgi:hypothetical protein
LGAILASGTITSSSGTVGSLTESAIQSLLNSQFPAASARAFQAAGWNGTFVATNDGLAGFKASSDSIVFLENYNLVLATYPIVLV